MSSTVIDNSFNVVNYGNNDKAADLSRNPQICSFLYNQRRSMDDCSRDEGEWRRMAEQGAERFMAKWIAAEKARAGVRHAVVCPNVTGRTKERIAQSKRARFGSFAIVD